MGSRLIVSAADIQKGEPVIFDSYKTHIDTDSIVACAGYPFYGIQWSTKDGRYLWDGSLLTNTPMLEAINASPGYNKKFYIVDVFPREQKELPTNMHTIFLIWPNRCLLSWQITWYKTNTWQFKMETTTQQNSQQLTAKDSIWTVRWARGRLL